MKRDVCTRADGHACAACAEEQQDGETTEAWLARLREIVRAAREDVCVRGHPKASPEAIRIDKRGRRSCRQCARNAWARDRAKRRSRAA